VSFFLTINPEQAGYSAQHPTQVIAVKLAGGLARMRADVDGATGTVNCTWLLDQTDYMQFMQFFNVSLGRGVLPFLVNLILDFAFPVRYLVQIVPGTLKTREVEGFSYRVSAELEVRQLRYFQSFFLFISTNEIQFSGTPTPLTFLQLFAPGDLLQITGAQLNDGIHPVLNLDGVYTVGSVPAANRILLSSPAAVNSDWNKLTSYPSSTASISNVAIINSPP
jgi:hypothetical protein